MLFNAILRHFKALYIMTAFTIPYPIVGLENALMMILMTIEAFSMGHIVSTIPVVTIVAINSNMLTFQFISGK
jgi:hypothetical protein